MADKVVGFFERSPKNYSMMRLLSAFGGLIGAIIALWGMFEVHRVVGAVIGGETAAMALLGTLGLIVAGALGVIGGSQGLKVLQQRGEMKENEHA